MQKYKTNSHSNFSWYGRLKHAVDMERAALVRDGYHLTNFYENGRCEVYDMFHPTSRRALKIYVFWTLGHYQLCDKRRILKSVTL